LGELTMDHDPQLGLGELRVFEHADRGPASQSRLADLLIEAQDRSEHLRAVLRALRSVHLLIAREDDPARLIQRAAELLIEPRGYQACAIVIGTSGALSRFAEAGELARRTELRTMIAEGQLPTCLHQATAQGTTFVRRRSAPPCERCPVELAWAEPRDSVTVPLEVGGRRVGALLLALAPHLASDPEEVELVREVAECLAHGLAGLERAQALRESEERYRSLIDNLDEVVFSTDSEGTLIFVSAAIERFGYTAEDLIGKPFSSVIHPDDLPRVRALRAQALGALSAPAEYRILDKGGRVRFVRSTRRRVIENGEVVGLSGVLTDLTEQRETEEQFRAAQKMEAVGRLAGGIAHDFNNLLTVISSYTEFVAGGLRDGDPLLADLAEVSKASLRAQALTRQLLAFSRKQMLQPRVLELNALVGGVEKMLRRLIGEDIALVFTPDEDIGLVRVDPSQIEQVLMNLAVNARDAMPQGGTLTISTANVDLCAGHLAGQPGALTGPAIKLSVADTGSGMDEATLSRIFEPFFTTKSLGKGTGLGLSTVYGIVKQSGGTIAVHSELERGTRFDIYLPREIAGSPSAPPGEAVAAAPARGSETVIVVEDEPGVRELACRILVAAGYHVLAAASGDEALRLWERQGGEVRLLVTDVVMPGMSGRELADRLLTRSAGLKVLYMSGYTDDAIAHRGVLDPGRHFIDKPFDAAGLTRKVRQVLDAG
jgi:PAS domain S-box-containing protein